MNAADVLKQHGGAIAAVTFEGDTFTGKMDARVLKNAEDRLVLAFSSDDSVFVLKKFNEKCVFGSQGYLRERDGLKLLAGSGLVPKLTHFSDQHMFIIQDYVAGGSVRDLMTEENCTSLCRSMGAWLAAYYKAAPGVSASGSWLQIMQQASQGGGPEFVEEYGFLNAFPQERTVLSRNDAVLTNVIVDEKGNFFGIDFEKSAWQPRGWDLLLTARAVVRFLPQLSEPCIHALADGFCEGRREAAKRWATLMKIFVATFVFGEANASEHATGMDQRSKANGTH